MTNIYIVHTIANGDVIHFQWNSFKAKSNFHKHGINFEHAISIWGDKLAVEYCDLGSIDEPRYVRRGFDYDHCLLLVVFTERLENSIIRIISARIATLKERKLHEEGI